MAIKLGRGALAGAVFLGVAGQAGVALADPPTPAEETITVPPTTVDQSGAYLPDGSDRALPQERCWRSDGQVRVEGKNGLGQVTMWGEQRNDWCDKDGKVSRWKDNRNQEPSGSAYGWAFDSLTADSGLTTTFPASKAYDRDDWYFRWLGSPIGSPQKHAYLDSEYRVGGGIVGEKGLG